MKNILVAADASSASKRAIKMAAQLAVQFGADLQIVHVIRDMQIPFEIKEIPELEDKTIETFNDVRETVMRKIAESVLKEAKETAIAEGASTVKTSIGTGDPATSILGFAKRAQTDMVVIGTRGLSKLKSSVLGSVSRKVANNAEMSCLIVR